MQRNTGRMKGQFGIADHALLASLTEPRRRVSALRVTIVSADLSHDQATVRWGDNRANQQHDLPCIPTELILSVHPK